MQTKLSVNINKLATLRNARGGNNPDIIKAALNCERFGAQGITVHPRPDERHIKYSDVYDLKKVLTTEFNIEGYPDEQFLKLVKDVKPDQCTLVPDAPGILTSDNGWDTQKQLFFLKDIIEELHHYKIRVSIFLNPDEAMVELAKETGADRIEFYTGPYAQHFHLDRTDAIKDYIKCTLIADKINLGINAGHDLDLDNLNFFKRNIKSLREVSIGHALICDSIYLGLENTIQLYLRELKD